VAWGGRAQLTSKLKSLTHVMSQKACHSRRWSGLLPPQHTRAATAGGLLSHQSAAGGRAWTETHRELPERAIARSCCTPFFLNYLPHFIFQAFPSISTGVYSYPVESATHVALGEVRKFLDTEIAKEACLVYGWHSLHAARVTNGARASYSSSA
jgi:hypothetical protein